MIPKLNPDIIILDVYMPGRDGIDVFKEIRSLDTPVDVIMGNRCRGFIHSSDIKAAWGF